VVKVVTINILFKTDLWMQRRDLLVKGLAAEEPDIIGLQEVNIKQNVGSWLAKELNMPYIYSTDPYRNPDYDSEPTYNSTILSRYPFIKQGQLDLQGQGRLAQYVQVKIDNQPLIFANGHYFWEIGPSQKRMQQMQLLVEWLDEFISKMPVIAVGDFNAQPNYPEMAFMREKFASAFAAYRGHEPEYTCPTPLATVNASIFRMLRFWVGNFLYNGQFNWRGTLDYIYINQYLGVADCRVILNQPSPDNPKIYPSDHFGLAADLLFR
jgi:endonuclease/exonuclease/phosphatase family metal-dependent hydrolase